MTNDTEAQQVEIRKLSDQALIDAMDDIVEQERNIVGKFLAHLCEVHRRRLFADLKYESLHDYIVKRWKYSESEANLRITGMYAILEMPEVQQKIDSGSISLSNIAVARRHFNHEEKIATKADGTANRSLTKTAVQVDHKIPRAKGGSSNPTLTSGRRR